MEFLSPIMAGIHQMLVRIANREDQDQIVSQKQSDLSLSCLASNQCSKIFKTSTVPSMLMPLIYLHCTYPVKKNEHFSLIL